MSYILAILLLIQLFSKTTPVFKSSTSCLPSPLYHIVSKYLLKQHTATITLFDQRQGERSYSIHVHAHYARIIYVSTSFSYTTPSWQANDQVSFHCFFNFHFLCPYEHITIYTFKGKIRNNGETIVIMLIIQRTFAVTKKTFLYGYVRKYENSNLFLK